MDKYRIGKYQLEIPPNFALPGYQQSMKLYDRFLPVLARHINSNRLIIDVGANIGDTTIAMLQRCENSFLCIEPSDVFFPYLETNLKMLSPADASRISTVKRLVGTGKISGTLNHKAGGTASLGVVQDSASATHFALDELVEAVSDVLLLKVDTDGFDFDVIQSAERILSSSEPILFWENEISEDFQQQGYHDLYSSLFNKGYRHVYIFDNFGNLISEESDFETLRCINSYLYSMHKYRCTRTFYYTDILASTDKNHSMVQRAVDDYKLNWINR